ncbi:hypothetical protein [uncultured Paludibaculum sp.]|uniref:hypothetical protein n=1 Tax=uncultured Paludibaculum sp. TaxID=1765020 RepID=UPI002AAAD9CC|nr:hypothetical protein [uncultured Paludibaculum sp.]
MELPAIGSALTIQYKRNPTVYSDPALSPRLYFGRVLRHEGEWSFVATLGNYDNVPQETCIEWAGDDEGWIDRDFHQPIDTVNFAPSADQMALADELAALPEEVPVADGSARPIDELRLRFLAAGFETGWLKDLEKPTVFYSDDFPELDATAARWHRQELGRFEISDDRVFIEWPVEGRPEEDWGVEFTRQDDGDFYSKSEAFGDEFEARLEHRDGYHALIGLWGSDEFLSFFGAILPDPR